MWIFPYFKSFCYLPPHPGQPIWIFLGVVFFITWTSLKKPNIQDITLGECNRHSGFIVCENILVMFLAFLFSQAFDLMTILMSVRSTYLCLQSIFTDRKDSNKFIVLIFIWHFEISQVEYQLLCGQGVPKYY